MKRFLACLALLILVPAAAADDPPQWVARPTDTEIAQHYPARALQRGVDGAATLNCAAAMDGALTCTVANEEPFGYGFGAAALALAPRFRIAPDAEAGRRDLSFSVLFVLPPDAPAPAPRQVEYINRPDASDFAANYPLRAWRQNVSGRVTLACTIRANGRVNNCSVAQESPEGYGFGEASLRIAGRFRVRPNTLAGEATSGEPIRIPMEWHAE